MRVLRIGDSSASGVLAEVRHNRDVLGIVPADQVDARVRVLTVGGKHPLRDPRAYPLQTTSTRPVAEVTTIASVGDIMLGRRVGQHHADDPGAPLRPLSRRLAAAEITVGNFESTLSTAGTHRGRAATPSLPARGCSPVYARPASTCCPWPITTSAITATPRCDRP